MHTLSPLCALNSTHSLISGKYHNEGSGDKLFLQPCVFFFLLLSCCQDCVPVYVNDWIFTPHGKYWDFHFTSLRIFRGLCKCSCLHLPHVYCWLPCTPTAGKAQVLYIALYLRIGKAPLIWVHIVPQGASHPVGEVLKSWTIAFSWRTMYINLTQHSLTRGWASFGGELLSVASLWGIPS